MRTGCQNCGEPRCGGTDCPARPRAMQPLICEHSNHSWERPSQRGRKPRFCPEHRELSIPAAGGESTPRATYDALIERALGALDRIHNEDVIRTVDYILTQLSDGLREPADEKHLAETLTHIIR